MPSSAWSSPSWPAPRRPPRRSWIGWGNRVRCHACGHRSFHLGSRSCPSGTTAAARCSAQCYVGRARSIPSREVPSRLPCREALSSGSGLASSCGYSRIATSQALRDEALARRPGLPADQLGPLASSGRAVMSARTTSLGSRASGRWSRRRAREPSSPAASSPSCNAHAALSTTCAYGQLYQVDLKSFAGRLPAVGGRWTLSWTDPGLQPGLLDRYRTCSFPG